MAAAPSLIFITGGVRSGKSSFAELTALEKSDSTGGKLHYIATGVPFDAEMKVRIKKHQQDREKGKKRWKTIEQPINVGELADYFHKTDIILLDCVTTLLNNELYAANQAWDEEFLMSVHEKVVMGILALKERAGTIVVVSNEVLNEPVWTNELVFTYKKLLGYIHQKLVAEADQAYLVEAGIPTVMKEGIG